MASNQPLTLIGGVNFEQPPNAWNLNGYTFDAWLRLHHNTSLTITQHPVQTGAAITDHSFVNPKRFSFEIGVTDVTAASNIGKPISGPDAKSINAYNILVDMQKSRRLLYLVSKYGVFYDILIESIDVPDDFQTYNSLKATVNLVQVILADVKTSKVSLRPQITDQTNRGQVTPQNRSDLNQILLRAGVPNGQIGPR